MILFFVFVTGICLLLYPSLSDYWNSFHQSAAIAEYDDSVTALTTAEYNRLFSSADRYNTKLLTVPNRFRPEDELHREYLGQLNITEDGVMGYIEIDRIRCSLPIYHGTDETVLEIGAGHMEGSSLPVGGENTHCVLTGHRGLPSARLFTDIDQLEEGDYFSIHVLNETLIYEVDQIRTVLPADVDLLNIEEGQDYCTLVTCTPYGINSHRLLVRGHRIKNPKDSVKVTSDAVQLDPVIAASMTAVPVLIIMLIIMLIRTKKTKVERKGK